MRDGSVCGRFPWEGEELARRADEVRARDAENVNAWSEEEDQGLLALIGADSCALCSIGQVLHRSPVECARRWRHLRETQ
jgi:hypothetical protein